MSNIITSQLVKLVHNPLYYTYTLSEVEAMAFPGIEGFNFAAVLRIIVRVNSVENIPLNIPGVPTNGISLFTNIDFEPLRLNRHVLPHNCKLGMVTFNSDDPDDSDDPDNSDVPENSDEFTVFILLDDSNHRPVYDDANEMVYRVISDSQDPFEIEQMLVNADEHLKSIFENNL